MPTLFTGIGYPVPTLFALFSVSGAYSLFHWQDFQLIPVISDRLFHFIFFLFIMIRKSKITSDRSLPEARKTDQGVLDFIKMQNVLIINLSKKIEGKNSP